MIYLAHFNININAYFLSFCYCMQHWNCYLNVKNIDHTPWSQCYKSEYGDYLMVKLDLVYK